MGSGHDQRMSDELAGIVDLFGGLTRSELERALSEVAFRADGQSVDEVAAGVAIETALDSFALVRYDQWGVEDPVPDGGADDALLVSGPTAFPRTPEHAEDLPHILDVSPRNPDRDALGAAARERFLEDVEAAIGNENDGNDENEKPATATLEGLIDLSYDLEAWASIDLSAERTRLTGALEDA